MLRDFHEISLGHCLDFYFIMVMATKYRSWMWYHKILKIFHIKNLLLHHCRNFQKKMRLPSHFFVFFVDGKKRCTAQKKKFFFEDFLLECDQICKWYLVPFTEEILHGKLHFSCSDCWNWQICDYFDASQTLEVSYLHNLYLETLFIFEIWSVLNFTLLWKCALHKKSSLTVNKS